MSNTGLLAESEEPAVERTPTGDQQAEQRVTNQLRLRPDAVAVNPVLKKIARDREGALDLGEPGRSDSDRHDTCESSWSH